MRLRHAGPALPCSPEPARAPQIPGDVPPYTQGPVSLTVGTRLGPYEIVAPLGAGGMGEVYRATDSQLKRSVAIKVLPASMAGDADRLTRFQREAEVLAALNHPNIAAIYGLGLRRGVMLTETPLMFPIVSGPGRLKVVACHGMPVA